jgi:Tfp pilus assembly protein PilN
MKLKLIIPWVIVLLLLAALGALYSTSQKQSAELAQLRQSPSDLQPGSSPTADGEKSTAGSDSEEIRQLRKDHEDVLRLRNEVRQLRDEKTQLAKQAKTTAAVVPNAQQQQQLEQLKSENDQLRQQTLRIQQPNALTACLNNLRQIDGAKQMWALENQRPVGSLVNPQDIAPYLANKTLPTCPMGGAYTLNPIGIMPLCNIPGHVLPAK